MDASWIYTYMRRSANVSHYFHIHLCWVVYFF